MIQVQRIAQLEWRSGGSSRTFGIQAASAVGRRALLAPGFGHALRRVGPLQQARAISKRLKKFRECRALPGADLDALTQFVTVMGFMFGFMRPAVLRQDRKSATKTATTIAKLLVRPLPSFPISHNGMQT